uniref:Uncharacterized protein n=1 Tax=Oryza brachyantha TaxID=4533 RepID=J3LWW5_ORYBR
MSEMNEQPQSPLKSTEYYIEKFLQGNLKYSMGLFAWDYLNTSERSTSDTDRFPSQRHSNSSNRRHNFEDYAFVQYQESSAGPSVDTAKNARNQVEQDADIQQENMHRYSSEQQIVTHSNESALTNNCTNEVSSGLEDCEAPKCGKASTCQGTKDALDITTERMNPQFGVTQGSEDNTVRRLRGKVFGMSSSASLKKLVCKRGWMQDKTFLEKIIPNEDVTHPADLISHENTAEPKCFTIKVVQFDSTLFYLLLDFHVIDIHMFLF